MTDKKTILVVDDVPDDIAILEEILKAEYHVKAVTNGEAALKIARNSAPPDLILLDIMMPDMDGFEVCRELKQDSAGASIPVIFLTAKILATDERMGLEAGAVDYLRKPVDPEILKARVRAQLEQKEEALRASEVKYRRLFETAQDGIMIVDTPTGGIIDVNPSLATIIGLPQESFLGKHLPDLEFLRTIMAQQEGLSEEQRRKYVRYRDLPLDTYDGRKIYIEFTSKTYQVNHRELVQLNIRDITDLVAAERERDDLSARLSHYLSTSPTITYSIRLKEGLAQWQWVSENIRNILGYEPEEALAPNWWFSNVNASDRAQVMSIISDLVKHETASREYRFAKKDRSMVWLHNEMRLLLGKRTESEIVGTLTDISERKKAEEDIHLKSAALEAAANAVVITDRDGVIQWANPAFVLLTGFSLEESVGRNPRDLTRSGEQPAGFYRQLWDTILSGKVWSGRLVNRRKSGEMYHEEMTITPVLDDARFVSHFIAIKNDITERVQAQKRLEAALRQKEELLREIHHRVNNNMQVIISLLNISAQDLPEAETRRKLEDITRRMHAMSIIHEQFYEAEDMSRIDFAVYLKQLLESLRAEFPGSSMNAIAICQPGQALLNLEQAVPAGLIVAELLSNAFKFAFADGRAPGVVRVEQRLSQDGRLEIQVLDDGAGLPPNVDPKRALTLGMMLMRILTEQLNGAMEFRSVRGTVATLSFQVAAGPSMPPSREKEMP